MSSCCALLVSSGEEANTCSRLGTFQGDSSETNPWTVVFHSSISNALNACFCSVSILTMPSQARPTTIAYKVNNLNYIVCLKITKRDRCTDTFYLAILYTKSIKCAKILAHAGYKFIRK